VVFAFIRNKLVLSVYIKKLLGIHLIVLYLLRYVGYKQMLQSKKISKCGLCDALIAANNMRGVCTDCWDKDDELYESVRSVMKFGEKFIPELISEKSGVDLKHIIRWSLIGRFGS
jgi:hypothetical protein